MSKQKNAKKTPMQEYDPLRQLRPGRHACECQAREHQLVANCLSCGRVVCEQEGSGPCFFCSALVCTREERELIGRETKEGMALLNKLTGGTEKSGFSLSTLGKSVEQAKEYRDKLLQADANRDKESRVNDLESDYYSLENNPYLSPEERQAIITRKEELRQMRQKQRKTFIVDLDFETGAAKERKAENVETEADPVIQAILARAKANKADAERSDSDVRPVMKDFVPKYDPIFASVQLPHQDNIPRSMEVYCQDDEDLFKEVERQCHCIALDQPLATLCASGMRWHVSWPEELRLRGPLLIASTAKQCSIDEVKKANISLSHDEVANLDQKFPANSIVGRAILRDCLTWHEHKNECTTGVCDDFDGGFVLLLEDAEKLPVPVPHVSLSPYHQVDRELRPAVLQMFPSNVV
ncbi:activating signal cointegrator 1 [Aphelenchoides avenae]|nr:activating signal cointegrator 1 [Aphelenchus avenae]